MMRRTLRTVLATGLLATGALADRALLAAPPGPTAAAAVIPAAAPAAVVPAAFTDSVDLLTERAFTTVGRSVVYVASAGVGSGSGVIFDTRGDIVTNAHVVAGATSLKVTLGDGRTLPARLVGADASDDLAVIRVNATGLPAARFAAAGTLRVAQTVLAIGNPLGLQQTVTSGLISSLGRTVQEPNGAYLPDAIQTSAPINPGNSGGALVTLDGRVAGIPTLQASDPQSGGAAQGIGFAVPGYRVAAVASQIIASGRVLHTGRAYLGVNAGDASAAASPYDTSTPPEGALVSGISAGSPAEAAGVQTGDVITAAGGRAVTGQNDLLSALAHARPGTTLRLSVVRNGSTVVMNVHLAELPAAAGQ